MTDRRRAPRVVRVSIVLVLVFNLMALLTLIRGTPIIFTLFMFLAQPVFVVALILLLGALVAELRARRII